jgi:hypothetical protein
MEECVSHLLEANGVFLAGLQRLFCLDGGFLVPTRQRAILADAIDVSIVQDREQPGAQVAATAETLLLFVGPQQRVVNQIFRIIRIAHERARIAPKRCKLADDIEWAFFPFHD